MKKKKNFLHPTSVLGREGIVAYHGMGLTHTRGKILLITIVEAFEGRFSREWMAIEKNGRPGKCEGWRRKFQIAQEKD